MTFFPIALKAGFVVASVVAAGEALEGAHLSLPTVGTVGLIVFGGVWKLSKVLAEGNSNTAALKEHVLSFEKTTKEAFERIETRMDTMPCDSRKGKVGSDL